MSISVYCRRDYVEPDEKQLAGKEALELQGDLAGSPEDSVSAHSELAQEATMPDSQPPPPEEPQPPTDPQPQPPEEPQLPTDSQLQPPKESQPPPAAPQESQLIKNEPSEDVDWESSADLHESSLCAGAGPQIQIGIVPGSLWSSRNPFEVSDDDVVATQVPLPEDVEGIGLSDYVKKYLDKKFCSSWASALVTTCPEAPRPPPARSARFGQPSRAHEVRVREYKRIIEHFHAVNKFVHLEGSRSDGQGLARAFAAGKRQRSDDADPESIPAEKSAKIPKRPVCLTQRGLTSCFHIGPHVQLISPPGRYPMNDPFIMKPIIHAAGILSSPLFRPAADCGILYSNMLIRQVLSAHEPEGASGPPNPPAGGGVGPPPVGSPVEPS